MSNYNEHNLPTTTTDIVKLAAEDKLTYSETERSGEKVQVVIVDEPGRVYTRTATGGDAWGQWRHIQPEHADALERAGEELNIVGFQEAIVGFQGHVA